MLHNSGHLFHIRTHPLISLFYSASELKTAAWNYSAKFTTGVLCFCQIDLRNRCLLQILSSDSPITLAFNEDADIQEWVLDLQMLIPAFLKIISTQPAMVDFVISLWIFKWLSDNCFLSQTPHPWDFFKYSFRQATTGSFRSFGKTKN